MGWLFGEPWPRSLKTLIGWPGDSGFGFDLKAGDWFRITWGGRQDEKWHYMASGDQDAEVMTPRVWERIRDIDEG